MSSDTPMSGDEPPEEIERLGAVNAPDYVVGVGASAGGLEALELLFEHMPLRTGMAFVIIQHLSPDYKSMMDELLARKTMIPIRVAADQMVLEADTIYLLPPKKEMIAANGRLYLTDREHTDTVNLPINTFFRSLAETYQEKSIAIVLSGTGSDGSKGVPLVHDSGGFVIAQSPESCKFGAMPENAIKTHSVDLVVDSEDMPGALIKYAKRTAKVEQQLYMRSIDAEVSEFSEILMLLNNRFDLDFSQYKPSTISRRLERRLAFQKTSNLRDYIDVLLSNQEELEALYYDLLIGVTQFFRDPIAFKSLRTLIPRMLETFKDEPEIRVWVAACATGQEAYSIAILLSEAMEADPNGKKPFKIFATDIHNKSILFAGSGTYKNDELVGLSPEQIKRFFKPLPNDKYQVTPELRKSIVFAQHNLLKDPPFTRTHLVTCRNVLIYFSTTAQQRVLSLLTFSLMNQGLLFLGPSEAIGTHESDFATVDSTYRLLRKTRDSQRRMDFPLTVQDRTQHPLPPSFPAATEKSSLLSAKSRRAMEMLLQHYVPASILLDSTGAILHTFGDAGAYLSVTTGALSNNIQSMVTGQAKAVISQMIHHIVKTQKPLKSRAVTGFTHYDEVDIDMRLLSELPGDLDYIIVSFSETKMLATEMPPSPLQRVNDVQALELPAYFADSRIKELEDELQFSQESLQSTVEELETSNEELQATNEELMASNEELQSTNEELQSVNEELFTVNAEFQFKERERTELKADERYIVEESDIGIVFLDNSLRLRKMSPAASKLFNLIESDYGRPFNASSGQLVKSIYPDIYTVYQGGKLIEREIVDDEGSSFLMRINAYAVDEVARLEADSGGTPTHGVVMTFTDISKYRALQNALEKSQERFTNTLNAISDGYFEWSLDSDEIYISQTLLHELGYADEFPDLEQLLGDRCDTFKSQIRRADESGLGVEEVLPIATQQGGILWMSCKGRVLEAKDGVAKKFAGILIDFSRQKDVEKNLHRQADDLERSNQLLEQFAHIVSHDMKAPLRHIQSYLLFLQQAIDDNDATAIKEEMAALKENTEGLGELIDDIITFSRVNSEKAAFTQVNMDALLDSVINVFSLEINQKNITIKRVPMPALNGDASLLNHLFQNLIGNACKYNDKDQPEIDIGYQVTESRYIVSVKDNGIGFDADYADKIFAPFQRLVTKEQYKGTGIGLSVCKTVVEQHGGTIAVTSKPGEGSCFSISFPTN